MYYIAAVLMVVCSIVVVTVLPDIRPTFKGKYADLMKSLLSLVKDYPALRIYAVRSGLAFGSFLAMWSCLAFKMGQAPFFANSDVVGMLGFWRRKPGPCRPRWLENMSESGSQSF